jgi:hypothetical protein
VTEVLPLPGVGFAWKQTGPLDGSKIPDTDAPIATASNFTWSGTVVEGTTFGLSFGNIAQDTATTAGPSGSTRTRTASRTWRPGAAA